MQFPVLIIPWFQAVQNKQRKKIVVCSVVGYIWNYKVKGFYAKVCPVIDEINRRVWTATRMKGFDINDFRNYCWITDLRQGFTDSMYYAFINNATIALKTIARLTLKKNRLETGVKFRTGDFFSDNCRIYWIQLYVTVLIMYLSRSFMFKHMLIKNRSPRRDDCSENSGWGMPFSAIEITAVCEHLNVFAYHLSNFLYSTSSTALVSR